MSQALDERVDRCVKEVDDFFLLSIYIPPIFFFLSTVIIVIIIVTFVLSLCPSLCHKLFDFDATNDTRVTKACVF